MVKPSNTYMKRMIVFKNRKNAFMKRVYFLSIQKIQIIKVFIRMQVSSKDEDAKVTK